MLNIPLQPFPSQTLTVNLGSQNTQLYIYQKSSGLYIDVSVNNSLIIGGVICENLNRIVRSQYLGFIGDLAFADAFGTSNPVYTGLGTQYLLIYLELADLGLGLG